MPVASPGAAQRSHPRQERARRPRLNPAATRLGLFDPYGALTDELRPAILLVEGRQVEAAHELVPNLPVVGVNRALTHIDADRIAAAGEYPATVYLWLRVGQRSRGDLDRVRNALTQRLLDAGVVDVLVVPHEGDHEQPAALLDRLGPVRAVRRLDALLRQAEWAGPFDPSNEHDNRNNWTVAA